VTKTYERIGTLPIGYADGFSRMLSGKAAVLLRGQRVPVLGTICMDQCMIALAGVEDGAGVAPVTDGEEVVIIGDQGSESISADDWADLLGTINYEVVCMITARVPRIYVKNGHTMSVVNPLVQAGQ
jgi:alanine racemase